MSKPKFPRQIVVKIEDAGTDGEWLNAQVESEQLAEIGEEVRIGVYELIRVEAIVANVQIRTKGEIA